MNTTWSAQDVERFREQQRWRLRQKSQLPHFQQQHFQRPTPVANNNNDSHDRARKVSLKFRREHDAFVTKQLQPPLSPHARAVAVTMRRAFALVLPTSFRGPQVAESPLPHTAHSVFNAFDSAASPEAFSLSTNNNHEDQEMASDDDSSTTKGSLWRRRFHVQGMEKHSPKIGRNALWDAPDAIEDTGNQATELVWMPLPFADDSEL